MPSTYNSERRIIRDASCKPLHHWHTSAGISPYSPLHLCMTQCEGNDEPRTRKFMVTPQSCTVVFCAIPDQSSHSISTSAPCGLGKRHTLDTLLHILGLLWKLQHTEGLISLDEKKGEGVHRATRPHTPHCTLPYEFACGEY